MELNNKDMKSKTLTKNAIIAFILTLTLFIIVAVAVNYYKVKVEELKIEQLIQEKESKINSTLSKLLYKTGTLAALVIQTDGKVEDFERVASNIVDESTMVNVVLAPDGIVSDVYPLENNEVLIGFNLLDENYPGNKEAILAKESGQLIFGGPFQLRQGGNALVGRLPIFIPDETGEKVFWGLVTVTLKYPEALNDAYLETIEDQGYYYEISRNNPDDGQKQMIAKSSKELTKGCKYIERKVNILNVKWIFRIYTNNKWYHHIENWILLICGLCISLLLASVFYKNDELLRIKHKLEDMVNTDLLTQIYNRKGLFGRMDQLIENNEPFYIYYMDLNSFKQINDAYGHKFGDTVLITYCERFKKHMVAGDIFARIGGDEFILVLRADREDIPGFWKNIEEEFQKIITYKDDKGIFLSFSKGYAVFPEHEKEIGNLIAYADRMMYKNKTRYHDKINKMEEKE